LLGAQGLNPLAAGGLPAFLVFGTELPIVSSMSPDSQVTDDRQ
jgi:hypothetical protein